MKNKKQADKKAQAGAAQIKVTRTEHFKVAFSELVIAEGFNQRIDYGDIEELKKSIIENGVRQPLFGYKKDGKFVITDGHRRHKAIEIAIAEGVDVGFIPFVLEGANRTEEQRVLDMLILNDGKDLTLLEKGRAYQKLVDLGWNQTKIAEKLGKSIAHVNSAVTIANTDETVQEAVETGELSPSAALEIARANETTEGQAEMLKDLKGEKPVKKAVAPKSEAPAAPAEPVSAENAEEKERREIEEAETKTEGKAEQKKVGVKEVKKAAGKGKENPMDKLHGLYDELLERRANNRCVIEDRMDLLEKLIAFAEGNATEQETSDLFDLFTCKD